MRELSVQGLSWCAQYGRPVVSLKPVEADWNFWITLAAEDAEAMALYPGAANNGATRALDILDSVNRWLDVTVSSVWLALNQQNGQLEAQVQFERCAGETLNLPVATNDAILVAWRSPCPIWSDDRTIDSIRLTVGEPLERHEASSSTSLELTGPVRQFIETLDFGDAGDAQP